MYYLFRKNRSLVTEAEVFVCPFETEFWLGLSHTVRTSCRVRVCM
jgi:hypothetical protein